MAADRVVAYMRVGTPGQIVKPTKWMGVLDNFSPKAPNMSGPLRCAIYIRVSTAEQADECNSDGGYRYRQHYN